MLGKVVNGKLIVPPVNSGNNINVYKDPEWLEANGFHELTDEELDSITIAIPEVRLSKLSIIEEAGEQWPKWKRKIEEAGAKDYWDACTYIVVGNKLFEPFWDSLTEDEKKLLLVKCRY